MKFDTYQKARSIINQLDILNDSKEKLENLDQGEPLGVVCADKDFLQRIQIIYITTNIRQLLIDEFECEIKSLSRKLEEL